ncbi:hypothetical protein GCM10012275_33060 [Longimycelium tulufanense]|uniref:Solute-binding protein family 3/N-terminal domain-containing protein n=2 Tax=Longimycelium tulufanense TaxID=907463 RepID=A0A8J3CFE8_9PSEU|nr:hypothetical protein GCM10012275_33060 [Longimycelium tulufanense]
MNVGRDDLTPPESKVSPSRGQFRRELIWVGPALLATAIVTAFLILLPDGASELAAIFGVAIAAVGLIVAILPIRLSLSGDPDAQPGSRRWRLWVPWTAAGIVVPAVLIASFWVIPQLGDGEPDPSEYLKGRVAIGINGKIPGWSMQDGKSSFSGFDVELGKFLGTELGFEPHFVTMDPGQRDEALPDRKTGRQGTVKLVISNYSITDKRKEIVDFSGPYFYDRAGLLVSWNKAQSRLGERKVICMTRGTTAIDLSDILMLAELESESNDPNLDKCMQRLFNRKDPVIGVMTDHVILDAYRGSEPSKYSDLDLLEIKPGLAGVEKYGIGLPNHSPNLCKKINAALDKFINQHWNDFFYQELKKLGIGREDHRPGSVDYDNCEE